MIRRRVVVFGRVQGVFYRDTCRRTARSAGVSGWVRNRRDGAVEAVFEGAEEAVDKLLRWAETGPPRAQVARMEVTEEPVAGERGFTVR